MEALLYIAGLLIGLSLFLYMLSLYNAGKDKIKELKGKGSADKRASAVKPSYSDNIAADDLIKIPPGRRICPICREPLTRFEPLYASQVQKGTESRILIYGCNYCYKEEKRTAGKVP